jgi:hypothetical protein
MALAALFTMTTACSDDSQTGPAGTELSTNEATDVAEATIDALDGILDGELEANPAIVSADEAGGALAFSSVPITREFEWTRQRDCRNGGNVSAQGMGVHVADRETGLVTIDFEGTKSINDCARARGDLVVTIDGGGTFEGHRQKLNGQWDGLQTQDAEGRFDWVTSDGRSGECTYEIHVVWDPSTGTKTIQGSVCDHVIDRTVTRDGRPGNDGRDG